MAKYICYFDSPDSSVHGYFGSTFFLCDLILFFSHKIEMPIIYLSPKYTSIAINQY